jgi:signal transduction histidine kinase
MPRRYMLLPPVFAAVEEWLADPSTATTRLGPAIARLAEQLSAEVGRLRVSAAPLRDLDIDIGGPSDGAELVLRLPGEAMPIGSVRITGPSDAADALARALELVVGHARDQTRAARAEAQLIALDEAVRGIGGVLDVDRVLQLIVDSVRSLVDAQFAAIGIVDEAGQIERFITSGISEQERAAIGDLPHGRGLLGLIIRENRSYRIRDIATHPERYGFPPHHPEMHAFLGMPILSRGEPVGRLYLTNKRDAAEFSADDQALVEMFALHAGIALENARLHDQVRRLAIVDERDRISRDLHDSVIQSIYAQTLALDDVPELMTEDPDEAKRRTDLAIDALHGVIRDIRNFIFGLRPVLLETGTIADGLRHLGEELRRNSGVEVEVTITPEDANLDGLAIEVVADLLAIAREALANVAKHANATRTEVSLSANADHIELEVADDGRGFDPTSASGGGHHGLANMRARTESIGGRFTLDTGAGGTRMIVALPRTMVSD